MASGRTNKPFLVCALVLSGWAAYATTITAAYATAITNVTSTTADGSYGVGANIDISVAFSGVVAVTGTPLLALNSGGTADYTSGSGTNDLLFAYVVAAGQNSPDLDYISTTALSLNGGTISDTSNVSAVLTLPAPGASGSLGANKNIVIDTTPPKVTNVSSTTPNGSYGVGAFILINVDFNKLVDVTGTPLLALNSGGTADYTSGSGTNDLMFTYIVAAGQNSPDLDYISTTSLTLNGGTLDGDRTLPVPGAAGSLSANKDIVIDTNLVSVPEPGSLAIFGGGLALLAFRRRRRRA